MHAMNRFIHALGWRKQRDQIVGWTFITPMMVGFVLLSLGPLIFAIYISFMNWPLLGEAEWVGLKNFLELWNDAGFHNVLKNTVIFAIGLVPLNIMLALFLALLLKNNFPGVGWFRTAVFVPVVTSLIVWSIVWKYMLAPQTGVINQALHLIGIEGPNWLYNEKYAMPAVIVISVIKNVGLNMILFLTALQQVPQNLYEAAELDGATRLQRLINITVPLITPTIFLTAVTTTIGAMKVFGQVYVMTRGGPANSTKVIVYAIWETAFKQYEMGYAAAMSYCL
mgnify:CR=1 FL=1